MNSSRILPLVTVALGLALLGGCTKASNEADSPSAKASAEALSHGKSDGSGKVMPEQAAGQSGGTPPKANALAATPQVAGEPATANAAPAANQANPTPTPAKK